MQEIRRRSTRLDHLNWHWITIQLTVAPILGLLVALPFWRKGGMIFGNIVATALLFAWAFALIFREHIEIERIVRQCLDDGGVCWPDPSAFTRFAVYALIGLVEVCGVFSLSLVFEKKLRDRDYAPEWR